MNMINSSDCRFIDTKRINLYRLSPKQRDIISIALKIIYAKDIEFQNNCFKAFRDVFKEARS